MLHVHWQDIRAEDGTDLPGGISSLTPAMILYGIDVNYMGIHSQQVDSLGTANGGLGYLHGNTLIVTTDCVDLPGDCKRNFRVSAPPDGEEIQFEVEIVRDANRIAHHVFLLRRLAESQLQVKGEE
jgi:hypothetical protein